jgi:hypothetical protein
MPQLSADIQLGRTASQVFFLALGLANQTPDFYSVKGAGAGDHATNAYMKTLRKMIKDVLGKDCSEKAACKGTKYAFDFYIEDERTAIEVALSLHNPTSEYERDIFKCMLAKDGGLPVDTLLFISKPGALKRHDAAGSRRIRALVQEKFGLRIEILELLPGYDVAKELKARASVVGT